MPMTDRFCRACGAGLRGTEHFCGHCGRSLAATGWSPGPSGGPVPSDAGGRPPGGGPGPMPPSAAPGGFPSQPAPQRSGGSPLVVMALAFAAVLLVGGGLAWLLLRGSDQPIDQVAAIGCEVLDALARGEPSVDQLAELQQVADAEGLSEQQISAALRERCPDLVAMLDTPAAGGAGDWNPMEVVPGSPSVGNGSSVGTDEQHQAPPTDEPTQDEWDEGFAVVFDQLARCGFNTDAWHTTMTVAPGGIWVYQGYGTYQSGEEIRWRAGYDPVGRTALVEVFDDAPDAFESVMTCP